MIAYIAFIVSLMAASPVIARFLIYFLYKPRLEIFFPPPNGRSIVRTSEIFKDKAENPLNIRNLDAKRDLQLELEFVVSKPVKRRPWMHEKLVETGLRGRVKGSGFTSRIKPFRLSAESLVALLFPFEPHPEEYILDVIVYSKMKMSEFGLPEFFGEVNLKPVKKLFTIKP